MGTSANMYMDAFGNITVNGKMLIPASANKHLTKTDSINLMTSFTMNSYTSTYSEQQLVLGLRQQKQEVNWLNDTLQHMAQLSWLGGFPAFGESQIGSVGLLYYDTDTIQVQNYLDSGTGLDYGDLLIELFDCDISSTKTNYTLKFEIADGGITKNLKLNTDKTNVLDYTRILSSQLSNLFDNGTANTEMLTYLLNTDGSQVNLFSSKPVVIANQVSSSKPSDEATLKGATRNYYNWIYKIYSGQTTSQKLTQQSLKYNLEGMTWDDFYSNAEDSWYKIFKSENTTYAKAKNLGSFTYTLKGNLRWDVSTVSDQCNRLCLVYPVSETMKAVSSILSVKDGTEFAVYSTMIYMTYLDWYGIGTETTISSGTNPTSNFDPDIFDESSDILKVDIGSIVSGSKSAEDMEDEVLQMSYLILHPEEGREYRKTLIQNGISDWLYEQYNEVVYGGYSETYSGSASKSNSGFLAIETYSDNPLTAWFMDKYVDMAVWIISIAMLIILMTGIFTSKKLSWYLISAAVVVNVVLITPSSGEIVPYVTSNFIQKMFVSKMTYWSISQGITNASIESDAVSQSGSLSGLTEDEASSVLSLVKQLSVIYTDRTLMVKQDISQKVTQATSGIYSDIQSYQSARWILPVIMQQFTGDNNSEDYIYKSLANICDDLSNMYWYFNPIDAYVTNVQQPTATSGQSVNDVSTGVLNSEGTRDLSMVDNDSITIPYADASSIYKSTTGGYFKDKRTDKDLKGTGDIDYRCYSYTLKGNVEDQVHLSAYILPDISRLVKSRGSDFIANYEDADSWQTYIDAVVSENDNSGGQLTEAFATDREGTYYTSSMVTSPVTAGFETTADSYDRTDRSTITPDMPYLLHTESPIYYFYNVVKDSFDTTSTLGSLIGQLQGQIEEDADGNEVRSNFMYATKDDGTGTEQATGYVRDILDLQELIENVVPYLYQMQLMTGGFDGESGVLGDTTITDGLQYYEGELQSWMYRCNWATKLMENTEYSESAYVRNEDGQLYKVKNLMMPEAYEYGDPDAGIAGREMVFSEAQMYAMGLSEGDLSVVELKCIEANKNVAEQWTLLINYAGTSGITKEILMRQMAIDATLLFNQEFSSTGILDTMYTMYPQSLDLRYLSFDSVMKMLIMNVSKNTNYAYGDTMSTLIEENDIVTGMLLYASAWLCANVVPFARIVLMAAIFYLGFCAAINSLLCSKEFKTKVTCGQLISNLLFMGYTLIYYAVFAALMSLSSSDDVLKTSNIEAHAGNPVWVIFIVIIASALYIAALGWHIWFCFHHISDMGFEAYSVMASGIVDKLSNKLGGAKDAISNFIHGGEEANSSGTTNTKSVNGTGSIKSEPQDVNVTNSKKTDITVETKEEEQKTDPKDTYTTASMEADEADKNDEASAKEIDAEIETGAKLDENS
jgi:hypothetical protein